MKGEGGGGWGGGVTNERPGSDHVRANERPKKDYMRRGHIQTQIQLCLGQVLSYLGEI